MVVLLNIFLFCIFVRPQDFVRGLYGAPVVLILMIVIGFVWILSKSQNSYKPPTQVQSRLMVAFWILVVLSTKSVFWINYTLETFIAWGKIVFIYFVVKDSLSSKEKVEKFIWGIVVVSFLTGLMGVGQYFGYDVTGVGTVGGRIRGVGIFDVNQLAYAMCYSFTLVFGLWKKTKNSMSKLFCGLAMAVYVMCIIFTDSRGGMLCLAASILVLFVLYSKSFISKVFSIGFAVGFLVLFMIVAPRLSTTMDYKDDASSMGRVEVWADALSTVKHQPIFGIGQFQFTEEFPRAAHSSYITLITEIGVFGLYVWLALFYFSFKYLKIIEKYKEDSFFYLYSKSLKACLAAYLFSSLLSSSAYYLILYIYIAIIVAMQQLYLKNHQVKFDFQFKDVIKIGLFQIVVIFAIHFLIKSSFG